MNIWIRVSSCFIQAQIHWPLSHINSIHSNRFDYSFFQYGSVPLRADSRRKPRRKISGVVEAFFVLRQSAPFHFFLILQDSTEGSGLRGFPFKQQRVQCSSDNGMWPTASVAGGVIRFLQTQNPESVKESPDKDIGVQGCGHSLLHLHLRQINRQNLHSPRSHARRITRLHFPQGLAPPHQNHQPGPVTSSNCPGRPGPALRLPLRRRTGV